MTIYQPKPRLGMQINRSRPLSRGLVACYVFNEKTGDTVFELSRSSDHGVLAGIPDWLNDGLDFNGSTHYINVPKTPEMTNLTISMGVKPYTITGNYYYSDFLGGNEFALISGYQDGYYNAFGGSYPTGNAADSQIPMSGAGLLDKVAWVKDGTNLKGYVNGKEEADVTISVGDFTPSSGMKIGSSYDVGVKFKGSMIYYMIWNRPLLPYEISWLNREPYAMFQQPINLAMLYYETPSGISIPVLMQQMNQFNGGLIA